MSWLFRDKKRRAAPERRVVRNKVRSFVGAHTNLLPIEEITDAQPLFSSGVLDSLQFVNLVLFVRTDLGVNLNDHMEVSVQSFDSIGQVVDAVMKASDGGTTEVDP